MLLMKVPIVWNNGKKMWPKAEANWEEWIGQKNQANLKMKKKETGGAKNVDQIMNTSPCLQRNKIKQKKPVRNEVKATTKERKSRRKLIYYSEKSPTLHSKTTEEQMPKKDTSAEIIKSISTQKTPQNNKKNNQIKKITQHFSQELLSNQVKLESMRKLYLRRKSRIDNKLEQMKTEDFYSTNNEILIEYPRPAKVKRTKLSEEQGKTPSETNVRIREGLRFLKQNTQEAPRTNEAGKKRKSTKKRLWIQKFEKNKRTGKVKKTGSKNNLQPKINIYHRVGEK